MKIKNSNIFIFESDEKQRINLRTQLLAQGASVKDFASSADFMTALEEQVCDLVVYGLTEGQESLGLGAIKTLKKQNPELPVIVLSDLKSETAIFQALSSGASGYLIKPFTSWDLVKSIRKILFPKRERSKRVDLPKGMSAEAKVSVELIQLSNEEIVMRSPLSFKSDGVVVEVENKIFPKEVRDILVAQVEKPSDSGMGGRFRTKVKLEGLSEQEREAMKKVYFPWR